MPRFFAEIIDSRKALIRGNDAAHILGPLRLRVGDELPIRNMQQGYLGMIREIHRGEILLEIVGRESLSDRGSARVSLAMSLISLKDMDAVIRGVTELGVAEIHPLNTARSNVHDITRARSSRWEAIVMEAMKQCQRRSMPTLNEVEPLETFITQTASRWKTRLVAHQGAEQSVFLCRNPEVGILIGPEGGFAPPEMAMILGAGFTPVSLGNTTLRSVTAALYAVGVLAQE